MKKLDLLDRQILQTLQQDGKIPFTEIALKYGVSEGTVRSRISRLLQEGIFQFTIHTTPEKLGYNVQTFIGFTTRLGYQQKVAEELSKLCEVRFVSSFSGKHDLIIQAYFSSNDELISFVNERLSKIEGIISVDVSLELKRYKDEFSYVRVDDAAINERN